MGRLEADAAIPSLPSGNFVALVRSSEELSIVVPEPLPTSIGARWQRGFVNFKVEGPLDFSLVGIIADLSVCLASAQISVFVVSSYDTDYVLIASADEDKAVTEWRRAGFRVVHN